MKPEEGTELACGPGQPPEDHSLFLLMLRPRKFLQCQESCSVLPGTTVFEFLTNPLHYAKVWFSESTVLPVQVKNT